jgi:4-hydroxybenzoyl-CoA thioesterase
MSKPTDHGGIRLPTSSSDLAAVHTPPPGPFVHSITVGWGDCDPAQIAYTASVLGWGLKALEAWCDICLGVNWFELNLNHGIGTPFVHMSYDFTAPITPRAVLECTVYVRQIGRSSLHHIVEGRQSGRLCFTGNMTSVFVAAAQLKPIAIPPNMRKSIELYAAGQGRALEDGD